MTPTADVPTVPPMNATNVRLQPGESVDFANGYVARHYWGSCHYYAEVIDRYGHSVALSPNFYRYALAKAWLDERS